MKNSKALKKALRKLKKKHGANAHPLFLMAALCASACGSTVPEYLGGSAAACDPQRLKGGIIQVIVSDCSLDWNDDNLVDQAFWQAAIDDGKLIFSGRVKGGGFNNNSTTEDTDACLPAEVTGNTWSALIKDFNVDLSGGGDVDFWNAIVRGRNKYQVAFRTSQDYLFGFVPSVASTKLTVPDTCEQLFNREVTFQWKSLDEPARNYIPFLSTLNPTSIIS